VSSREHDPSRPTVRRNDAALVRRLLAYARPYALPIAVAVGCGIGFAAGRFGRAYLMKPLVDDVLLPAQAGGQPPADSWLARLPVHELPGVGRLLAGLFGEAGDLAQRFAALLVLAALAVVVTPVFFYLRGYLSQYVLGRISVDIQRDLAAKLLVLPLSFHSRSRRGDTLTRSLADVHSSRAAYELLLAQLLQSGVMIAFGAATLFLISWPLASLALVTAPLVAGLLAVFARQIRKTSRRRQEQLSEVTQRLIGILSGIKVIKAFRGERLEEESFGREAERLFRRNMKVVEKRILSRSLLDALNSATAVGLLLLGAALVVRGRWGLTTGDVAAFATVLATTYRPVKSLSQAWAGLAESLASAERFFALLDLPEEPEDRPGAVRIDGIQRGIRFDRVAFRYAGGPDDPEEPAVLQDVSLAVRPGEVVGIVGRTGTGKTTLVDLLLRFRDVDAGAIEIDGHDIRDIARDSLLDQIAIVSQDAFLFDASIRDNIHYGRPTASETEVLAAARTAHVDEFVDQLPLGYDTPVGEFGVRLSGGQRQRITIARALLKRPAILVFDEATSALDAKTERTVQEAIEALRGQRTIFVVAHRLSTIRNADRIVVLSEGRIAQQGRHAELFAQPGLYRELVRLGDEPPG